MKKHSCIHTVRFWYGRKDRSGTLVDKNLVCDFTWLTANSCLWIHNKAIATTPSVECIALEPHSPQSSASLTALVTSPTDQPLVPLPKQSHLSVLRHMTPSRLLVRTKATAPVSLSIPVPCVVSISQHRSTTAHRAMTVLAFAPLCGVALRRSLRPASPLRLNVARSSTRHSRVRVPRCVETPTPKTEEPIPLQTAVPGEDKPSFAAGQQHDHHGGVHLAESPRSDIGVDVMWTLGFIALAGIVAGGVVATKGIDSGIEFVTAYIVEYSLSVDNLFVFLLIFKFFQVPRKAQLRVLSYGVVGAMVMRGIMISLGEALTKHFEVVSLGFAALLLYSAAKLLLEGDKNEDEDLEQNSIVRFSRSLLPFSDHYDGDRFFTFENSIKLATPLMLVLLSVEFSDVVFALDSVPAVLGISDDTVVIYLSNILAILGLRNLFFVLSDAIGDLRFLRQALAIVLGFVGSKMFANVAGFHIDVLPSLAVVVGTLGAGVGLSVAFPEPEEVKVGE